MSDKKLALISHSSHMGGAERSLVNFIKSYSETPLLVLVPEDGVMLREIRDIEFVDCIVYPRQESSLFACKDLPTDSAVYWVGVKNDVEYLRNIYISHGVTDVVVNTTTFLAPCVAAILCNIPYYCWSHGVIDSYLLGLGAGVSWKATEGLMIAGAEAVFVPSPWVSQVLKRFNDNVEIVGNPVIADTPSQIERDPFKYAIVGTLEENKNQELAIRAIKKLRDQSIPVFLNIWGSGPDEMYLKNLVKSLGMEHFVFFKGRTTAQHEMYGDVNGIIACSKIESFGMAVAEAALSGAAVLASDNLGHKFLFTSLNYSRMYLFKGGDLNSLVEIWKRVIFEQKIDSTVGDVSYIDPNIVSSRIAHVLKRNISVGARSSSLEALYISWLYQIEALETSRKDANMRKLTRRIFAYGKRGAERSKVIRFFLKPPYKIFQLFKLVIRQYIFSENR